MISSGAAYDREPSVRPDGASDAVNCALRQLSELLGGALAEIVQSRGNSTGPAKMLQAFTAPAHGGATLHVIVLIHDGMAPTAPAANDPYLTIKDTAKLLKVGEDTVERLIASGQLEAIEISGRGPRADRTIKRISREAIDEFARNSVMPTSPAPARRRPKNSQPGKDYF